ncbi:MAG: gamma-glutamylcyclotransferase [Rhodanobacteraceae bacterium]
MDALTDTPHGESSRARQTGVEADISPPAVSKVQARSPIVQAGAESLSPNPLPRTTAAREGACSGGTVADRREASGHDGVWLFGYGSLIYKVDFPWLERRRATVRGWSRRFWQGSHDHRGTPQHPGRVVTLVPTTDALCTGMAYRVAPATFRQLDFREKNGYVRRTVLLDMPPAGTAEGIAYIAPAGNPAWLGAASVAAIARHIAGSAGPSGSNRDYVVRLAESLREMGVDDPHVFAIERELRELVVATR